MSYDVVNGYVCKTCTDVDYAKRNIDPQHPKDGPFGVNKSAPSDHGPAVVLGGTLAKSDAPNGVAAVNRANASSVTAATLSGGEQNPGRIDFKV